MLPCKGYWPPVKMFPDLTRFPDLTELNVIEMQGDFSLRCQSIANKIMSPEVNTLFTILSAIVMGEQVFKSSI